MYIYLPTLIPRSCVSLVVIIAGGHSATRCRPVISRRRAPNAGAYPAAFPYSTATPTGTLYRRYNHVVSDRLDRDSRDARSISEIVTASVLLAIFLGVVCEFHHAESTDDRLCRASVPSGVCCQNTSEHPAQEQRIVSTNQARS